MKSSVTVPGEVPVETRPLATGTQVRSALLAPPLVASALSNVPFSLKSTQPQSSAAAPVSLKTGTVTLNVSPATNGPVGN